MQTAVLQLLRGFTMGAADVVPGVSGGTVALVLGIYERLVDNIRLGAAVLGHALRGDIRGARERFAAIEWRFLLPLLAGILAAVAVLASLIDTALEEHPEEMAGLFCGLVGGSVVVAWRLVRRRGGDLVVIAAAVGVAVFALLGLRADALDEPSTVVYFLSGALAICAMILPGISGSFLLLMVGMYGPVLGAVSDRDLAVIVTVGLGAVVGLALFSTVLHRMLEHHHDRVIAAMIGLMLGSFRVLWPWPNGVGLVSRDRDEVVDGTILAAPEGDVVVPIVLAVVSFVAVVVVGRLATAPHPTGTPSHAA